MAKLRVLLVDDDEVVLTLLSSLLNDAQHVVHTLPSAIGVTRALLAHQIDVVAIDITMPSLPGDKLAALLRQNPRLKSLGVVLISSRPADELEAIAKQVAADAVVSKGDARTKLVAAVELAARLHGKFP
jgi:CheY-like chemotaxis protein